MFQLIIITIISGVMNQTTVKGPMPESSCKTLAERLKTQAKSQDLGVELIYGCKKAKVKE
jgi:hypothetical protein